MTKSIINNANRILAAALVLGAIQTASAQSAPRLFDFKAELARTSLGLSQSLSYIDATGKPKGQTRLFVEALRGNGTRAGYMLSHGGVVPGTLRVSVGARSLKAETDYTVDFAGGGLMFVEPVRPYDSISVSYQYVDGYDASRNVTGTPGIGLKLRGSALNLGYAVSSLNGVSYTTYGLAHNSKVGTGSTLSGLLYFSSGAASNSNTIGRTNQNGAIQRSSNAKPANDRLLVQNFQGKSGKATFNASYQDVGTQFAGFSAMRNNLTSNPVEAQQLAALEKERGIKRMSFGGGLATSKTSNLGLNWDNIGDGTGSIVKQGLNYTAGALKMQYQGQTVGTSFQRFGNLRDGEAAQWARERGVSRSNISLAYAPTKGGALSLSQNKIGDRTGGLTGLGFNFAGKNQSLSYNSSKADQTFSRLNDLSDADKTAIALGIRQQFNAAATAGEVTAKDKEQVAREAGLSRTRWTYGSALGKGSTLGFNQFSVSDGSGSVQRTTLSLAGKGFSLNYLDQNISQSFSKLGSLNDFERSQYNNELGMRRTALGMNLTLSRSSTLSYNQSTASDSAGSMSRQSLAYAAKGFDARVNLGTTASSYARARDMAYLNDAERAGIEGERGFRRMDFAANLTSIRNLTLSTTVYNAVNSELSLTRNNYRHAAGWTPNKATRINYLSDGNSSTRSGIVANGIAHQLVSIDQQLKRGMKWNAFRDEVTTTANGAVAGRTTTNFLHFETDRSKANNLLAETKRIGFSDGRFENTTVVDMNWQASKAMGFHMNRTAVDRGREASAATSMLDWKWQASKTLSLTGQMGATQTNTGTGTTFRGLTLATPVSGMFSLAGSYSEAVVQGKNNRSVAGLSISSLKPMNILGLRNASVTLGYAGVHDQQKQQTENVSAKVQGLLGKNTVALEYGGALDAKGNSGVSRGFSFVSDRNEKLPVHFSVAYKARNVNRGNVQLVRNYNLALRLSKTSSLTYAYNSLPEDGALNMQQLKSSGFTFKHALNAATALSLDYTTSENLANRQATRKLGASLIGKLDKVASFQAGYSVNVSNINGQNVNAHAVSLGFDRRIDADHSVAFNTVYTMNMAGRTTDVQANVEFKTRF